MCCQLGIIPISLVYIQSVQGYHAIVTSTSTSDCKSDTLSVSDKAVPKLIPTYLPTLQLEAQEL